MRRLGYLALCLLLALPLAAVAAQGMPPLPERLSPWEHDGRSPEVRAWGSRETTGTVETAHPTSRNWHIERVDAPKTFSAMGSRSLALDASGHPHIAYGEDHLYYAWHDGSAWHRETVDTSWDVGRYASLALDGAGRPHISYYDDTHDDLRYAYFDGTTWLTETVDSPGDVGQYTSLALDTAGRPHISYHDYTNTDLKHAYFDGTSWQIETVDNAGDVGEYNSLTLDTSNRPHISYRDLTYGNLKYAYFDGTIWQIETADSTWGVGWYTSLALDASEHPHISYMDWNNSDLRYARFDGTIWQIETVDPFGDVGRYTSLALDLSGRPHISYFDRSNNDLKYARHDGATWLTETVDSGEVVGRDTSLALDTSGRPHISYCRYAPSTWDCDDLKYARFDGVSWLTETVDSAGQVGLFTSLALDLSGRPHISYFDLTHADLKYAHFDGVSWLTETVDPSGDVGEYTSLALDGAGRPHISYFDLTHDDLKYAHFDGSAWQIETVDDTGRVGEFTSLALDTAGRPHISYFDNTNNDLKYAHFDGASWQIETVDGAAWGVGKFTSLALDASDRPHISYYDSMSWDLKYAYFDGTTWQIEAVDRAGDVGQYTSLALDASDNPHISYCDLTNGDLKYTTFDGTSWEIKTVDSAGRVGQYTSLALDSFSQPHISYHDNTNKDLKYAWGECVPVAGVIIEGPAVLPVGHTGLYTAAYTPPTATLPVTIDWDNGSVGPAAAYSWDLPGTYTVTVTASNPCSAVSDAQEVTVICQPPERVTASGPSVLFTNQPGTYRAVVQPITASLPLTYTWDNGTIGPTNVYSWSLPGLYTHTLTATNECGQVPGTFSVTVACLPVQESDFSWGPLSPTVGQAVYLTATVPYIAGRWLTETVDSAGDVGLFNSLALDASGQPSISYYDSTDVALKYAHREGTSWQVAVVDAMGGSSTSLALDRNGRPHISYAVAGLRYAYYDGTDWLTETLTSGTSGPTSLALDSFDHPHISNYSNSGLEYAWYDGSTWHIETVDNIGNDNSLALDGEDRPHISYRYGQSGGDLRYAWYDGSTWHIETVDTDGETGKRTSLALDSSGRPHISYIRDAPTNALKYAHYDGTGWQIEIVDSGDEFNSTSLALDAAGRLHIAYHNFSTDELKYAYWDGTSWQIEVVDYSLGMWGGDVSLELDADGWPQLSYNDRTNGDLRYARLEALAPTAPLTFTWALGDGGLAEGRIITHTYDLPGTYTVLLTVTNCQGAGVATATHAITVEAPPCEPVADADFDWTPPAPTPGEAVTFTGTVAAGDPPITFTWGFGDGTLAEGETVTHTYDLPGTYTVHLTATNPCGQVSTSSVVEICQPVEGAEIAGPAVLFVGQTGLYTATYTPPTATLPVTLTWDSGALGPTAAYSWTVPGHYTLTVTATNPCGQAWGMLPVEVQPYTIYLPLVLRGW